MPGNIVCGICGAVRYYAFILQAKKFGTFSCEPCRKFISKTIKKCNNSSEDDELFPCLTGSGLCVVPPVLRATSGQPKKAETSVPRCQACWLKLCLIGKFACSLLITAIFVYYNTRIIVYKKRSKNLDSLNSAFLYSCFLFLMMYFGQ